VVPNLARTAVRPHAIGDRELKPTQSAFSFIHNRVFGADVLFIRTKNTVGARSAQCAYSDIDRCGKIARTVPPELARPASRPHGSPIAYGWWTCPHAIGDLGL